MSRQIRQCRGLRRQIHETLAHDPGGIRSRPPAVRLGGSRDSGECRYRDGPQAEGRWRFTHRPPKGQDR